MASMSEITTSLYDPNGDPSWRPGDEDVRVESRWIEVDGEAVEILTVQEYELRLIRKALNRIADKE